MSCSTQNRNSFFVESGATVQEDYWPGGFVAFVGQDRDGAVGMQAVGETCARWSRDSQSLTDDGNCSIVGHTDIGSQAPDVVPPGVAFADAQHAAVGASTFSGEDQISFHCISWTSPNPASNLSYRNVRTCKESPRVYFDWSWRSEYYLRAKHSSGACRSQKSPQRRPFGKPWTYSARITECRGQIPACHPP